jgi:hypothetical protein
MIYVVNRMSSALSAIRGNEYKVTSSCVACIRPRRAPRITHITGVLWIRTRKKPTHSSIEFSNEFVPPMVEMKKIIKKLCSAMTELCLVTMDKPWMKLIAREKRRF